MLKHIAASLVVLAMCTSPALAGSKQFDAGVASYNARQYSEAVPLFQKALAANPKDEAAHYYLGLTYQAMGRRSDAEREYRWNYENGANKDLKYKSWQGLSGLAKVRASAPTASAPSASTAGATKVAAHRGLKYNVEKGTAPIVEATFVRGCGKH
jgi:tetratricopeptide (TPR) repeat protein